MSSIALVTGASSGVGRTFVHKFDEGRGGPLDEIWAVARSQDALEELSKSCKNIPVRPLVLDLTDEKALDKLEQMLTEDITVQWLVNSAGFGTFGMFGDVGRRSNAGMVRLNCLSLTEVISIVLPHTCPGSRIINLSSIAGVVPQVELATYSASKAFVLELSRMLDHELASCGVRVMALCPKFMRTKFLNKPGDDDAARRMTRIGFEDVDRVVSKALRASLVGRPLCITSPDMRAAHVAAKLLPRRMLFLVEDLLFSRI